MYHTSKIMNNRNILICGAGISGLTLAYWLKKYGFNPTLVEKHPNLRTEGYKLDIRGKAVDIIRKMGLYESIYKARTDIQKAQFVDSSGKVVSETTPDFCGLRSEGDLEIVRGSLCRILYDQLSDVEFLWDDSIKSLREKESGIYVEFNKSQGRQFDLVIGADGLHSRVRKSIFGNNPEFLKELGLYVSFYSIPNFLNLDRVEIEYHAPPRFAIAYCSRDGFAKAGFAFASPAPKVDLSIKTNQQSFLKEAFSHSKWEISNLLSYMNDSPDFYFDCMAQVHMPHYTKGRAALVGDAGYAVSPMAGQGTSVALVGAYLLAGELYQSKGDYKIAFQRYEENLKSFVSENQKLALMSLSLMQDSWYSKMVLSLSKLLPGSFIEYFKKSGLKKMRRAANAIDLKNY